MSKKNEECTDDDLDDLLEKEWKLQDQIHRKCKMKDKPEEKMKNWKKKYG